MGWAQFDRRAHVAGGLGAIRSVCRGCQAFDTFLALGIDKANPRLPEHPRGLCFRIPPGNGFPHAPGHWVCACLRALGFRMPLIQTKKKRAHHARVPDPERGKHSVCFLPPHEHSHEHSQHAESTT